MTEAGARTAANVILASAAVAAAYVLITTPPLRRLAARATRIWLGASVPIYFGRVVRDAWMESARAT